MNCEINESEEQLSPIAVWESPFQTGEVVQAFLSFVSNPHRSCTGSGWGAVHFLHSSLYDNVLAL